MKKTGKSWNCSVCDIQTGNLYNTFKKGEDSQIKSDMEMMGGEDRDAPVPAPKIIKIKIKRRPVVSGQVQAETLQPSPIPPPEPLVPADANTRTALALLDIPDDPNINNKYRLEIMLALTYLVPTRIATNDSQDRKTYNIRGTDVRMDEVKKEVKQRLHELVGRPFTGRDATKLANEIVEPGEKSHRIKVMIKFMDERMDIGLPDEVTKDWKFKYLRKTGRGRGLADTSGNVRDHSNIFATIDLLLDIYEYGGGEDDFPEEEGPLSPIRFREPPPDELPREYQLYEFIKKELGKPQGARRRQTIDDATEELSNLVEPGLKAELESGYFTARDYGGTPKKITFELIGDDVVFRDDAGDIINRLRNKFGKAPLPQLYDALRLVYIWREMSGRKGYRKIRVLRTLTEFKEFASNVFRR
jgi:hypothetical protein